MKNFKKALRALTILLALIIFAAPFAVSTPEISKKEDKQCVACHTALGKPDLNDAGKYYKVNRTLKGYEEKKKPQP